MHELTNKQKQLEKNKKPDGIFDNGLNKKTNNGTLHTRFNNNSSYK